MNAKLTIRYFFGLFFGLYFGLYFWGSLCLVLFFHPYA